MTGDFDDLVPVAADPGVSDDFADLVPAKTAKPAARATAPAAAPETFFDSIKRRFSEQRAKPIGQLLREAPGEVVAGGESLARGIGSGLNTLGSTASFLTLPIAKGMDAIARAGGQQEGFTDDMGRLTDQYASDAERVLREDPRAANPENQVLQAGGAVVPDLLMAIASGGESAAIQQTLKPVLQQGMKRGLQTELENMISQGAKASVVPSLERGTDLSTDVINAGGTVPEALGAFGTGAAANTAAYMLPGAAQGNPLVRAIEGAAVEPVGGYLQNEAENAALPNRLGLDKDYDARQAIMDIVLGGGLGAAMGSPEAPKLNDPEAMRAGDAAPPPDLVAGIATALQQANGQPPSAAAPGAPAVAPSAGQAIGGAGAGIADAFYDGAFARLNGAGGSSTVETEPFWPALKAAHAAGQIPDAAAAKAFINGGAASPVDLAAAIGADQLPPELAPRTPAAPVVPEGITREDLVTSWQAAETDAERAQAAAFIAAFDQGKLEPTPAERNAEAAPAPMTPAVIDQALAKIDARPPAPETVTQSPVLDPDAAFRRPEPAPAPEAPESPQKAQAAPDATTVPPQAPAEAVARAPADLAAATRREIGWMERGGKMIRNGALEDDVGGPRASGDVVGRTPWVAPPAPDGAESQLWRTRPDKNLTEKQAGIALDKFERGEPLRPIEQRFVDHSEAVQRGYEETEAEIQGELAAFEEGDRVRALRALREDHGIAIAEGERSEALGLVQLVQRAMDAGLDEVDVTQASNETDGAYADRLWQAIKESNSGRSETESDRASRDQGQEGGQARAEQQRTLFADPTAREQAEGLSRARDDERNGKTGRETPAFSSTDLGAGVRPEQADVEGGRVESQRDMFVPTRGDRKPIPLDTPQPASALPAEVDPPAAADIPKWASNDPVRPDFDARTTRRAANEIDTLLERFGGSVIADEMVRDFRATQTAELVGQVAKNADDFAVMAQIYRNPLFETMHYAYVDADGVVLKQSAISSRMPSSSAAFPTGVDNGPRWVRDEAPEGATGVWLLHNHPSSNPTPSIADLDMTQTMVNQLKFSAGKRIAVLGHVILNHNRFGLIEEKAGTRQVEWQIKEMGGDANAQDPFIQPRGKIPMRENINGPQAAAGFGRALFEGTPSNSSAAFFTNAQGEVKTAVSIPNEVLATKRGAALLSTIIDRSGGDNALLVVRASVLENNDAQIMLRDAVRSGMLRDVVVTDATGKPDVEARKSLNTERVGRETETRSASRRRRMEDGGERVFDNAKEADAIERQRDNLLQRAEDADAVGDEDAADHYRDRAGELSERLEAMQDAAATTNPVTETPEFRKWFGDSKVVDDNGDPLVVYHGTGGDFDVFQDKPGMGAGGRSARLGFFFSDSPGTASQYATNTIDTARNRGYRRAENARLRGEYDEQHALDLEMEDPEFNGGMSPSVMASYLSMQNPLEHDFAGRSYDVDRDNLSEVINQAKADGHDGVIFRNFDDAVHGEDPADHYVVFKPTQIKSATGNNGQFDSSNPSVVRSPKTPYQAYQQQAQTMGKLAAMGYTHGAPTQPTPGGRFETLQRAADAVRTKLQDKMLPLLRAQERTGSPNAKAVTSVTLADAMNAYRLENLMHGRAKDQVDRANEEIVLPAQRMMKNLGVTPEMVQDVMLATHAPERNKKVASIQGMADGAAGITTKEAGEILAGTAPGPYSGGKLTPEQIKNARLVWDKFRMLRERTIDNMVEAGQISRKEATTLRAAYKHYVPLRGKDSPFAGEGAVGTGRGLTVRKSPIKRALGRGKGNLAKNMLGEIVGDFQRSVATKEKSRVVRGFLKFALDNPMPDIFKVEPVDLEWKYNELTGEAYLGVKSSAEDAQTSIIARHDGEPVRIRFEDTPLRDAMMNMGVDDLSSFVKIVGSVNRWRSKVLTQYNPAFTPINVLRDLQFGMSALVAERGLGGAARAGLRYLPAMRAAWRDAGAVRRGDASKPNAQKNMDDWAAEAAQAGMKTGLTQVDDVQDLQRRLSVASTSLIRLAAQGRVTRLATESLIRPVKAIAETVERINDATENALRLATYIGDRKAGKSVEQAAEYAKNLTINFNRKGQLGPALNALYLFYNASVQGTHAVQRVLRNPKVLTYLAGLAGLQAMLADQFMDEDDEGDGVTVWDEIPDYVKRTSFVIPLGMLTGNKRDYFALPMPYGFNIFPYMGGRSMQRYRMGARDTDSNVVTDILKAQVEAFSPVPVADGYNSLFGDTIGFMLSLASNTDDFGSPIAAEDPYGEYDQPKALMGKADTPRVYQVAAQLLAKLGGAKLDKRIPPIGYLDIAPEQIESVVNYMGGGLAALANKSQRWYEQLDAGNLESAMDVIAATPIASRLAGTTRQDRAIAERYYGERGELARKKDVLQDELRKVEPDKKPVRDPDTGKAVTAEERKIRDLAEDDFAYKDLAPETYKGKGKRGQKPGQVKRTSTDGVELNPGNASPYSTLKNTEKGNKAANRAIRQLRALDLTNAEAVQIVEAFSPTEDVSSKAARYSLEDLGLPKEYKGDAPAPARVRNRAIKLVQDSRMINQRTLLRILRMSRTDFDVGKKLEAERGDQ